jgi:hypothetical protein
MFLSVIEKPISTVETTARYKPGSRFIDKDGNEFIYALGIDSTVVGSWVAFSLETTNNTPITALLTKTLADAGCSIGIAMGLSVASTYGWYQISGTAEGLAAASDAADALQYTTANAGILDDLATSQTKIRGIRLVDTDGGSGGLCTFIIQYPHSNA